MRIINKLIVSLFAICIFSTTSYALSVTIEQKVGQPDPTNTVPVLFTVTFSEAINEPTFTSDDLSFAWSTATDISVNSITEVAPMNGTTFEVSVSATGNGTIVASIPAAGYTSSILGTTGSYPAAITIDAAGNIYTANSFTNNVSKISPSGVSSILGTTGTQPYDITIDAAGNIYTANFNSDNVSKISLAGLSSILGTTGSRPSGITIDAAGNIFTANLGSNNVSKISPAGVSSILGTTGSAPYAITIDAAGNIFTANLFSYNVSKISPSGVSSILDTTGINPYGITIDAAGNIFTANAISADASKISPTGVSSISLSALVLVHNPRSITIDAAGNIYTANLTTDNVSKFTLGGILDLAGNSNSASTSVDNSVTIDTTAPAAPGTPDLQAASDTGSSSTDNITSDTTPVFDITCAVGNTVNLKDGATVVGTASCAASPVSITSSTLSSGSHTITATQTDDAGNESVASGSLSVSCRG